MDEHHQQPQPNIDPFLVNYQPSELRIASEFLNTWLPFLTKDLCRRCSQSLSDRIRSIDPESKSQDNTVIAGDSIVQSGEASDECDENCDSHSLGSWKDVAAGNSVSVVEVPSLRMSWADMAQEDDEFGEDSHEEDNSSANVVVFGSIPCETKVSVREKPTLSREQREHIRFMNVRREKDFICFERVNGKLVNILQGLELHTGIFSAAEQKRIVSYVTSLQEMGRNGELKGRTFSAPQKWMRGKGRQTIQFGCCYNYAVDRDGNPPGILKTATVDPIPDLFKVIIRRLVKWHVLPPTCVPDSCIVNIYEEGDCIPPHIDNHDFVRPFCTVSFLSECDILFGSNLKIIGPGEFDGSMAIPLPVGSVLVLNGNGADVAKHCVPAVPTKRISITFRRMDPAKRPLWFVPEPDLQGIQPLAYEGELEKKSSEQKHNRHTKRHNDGRGGRNDATGSATRNDRFSEPRGTAKAIFNQIHLKFMCRSFIENIREVCESDSTRGLINLQEQLLSDVLKTKEKIHSISMGTAMVEKRLKSKRALIILDDVTTSKQLKALCGNHQWFGSGSVIIVTTRDVRLLKSLKVDNVYKMEEMNQTECLELFSWHAFGEASPRKNLIGLSTNVVAYCGGLPLALEVLGSYLNEREELEWKSVLSKLERIPNDQVQEKLRISYDGLKDELEKDIFLDICCFFIGKGRVNVTDILNGCGLHADIGITILIERSLIKVDKNNKLRMHDLVRDMGREIVRECSTKDPGKRSRLWFHEDVHDVLTKYIGTETVEGLILKLQNTGRVCFSANAFKEMRKLRLLQLDCVDLTGDFGHLSHELKWVYWKGFTSTYLPNHFYQGNLVVLELKYSSIKRVWKETKLLVKLKILNLSHSKYLVNTPDFSKLPNLEKLILKDCPSLFELHHSIGDLRNLLLINLEDCTNLNNLPGKTYQLKSVKTLILSGCSKIDKLEEDIVQMESLTTLIAKDTAIKEVPYSILGLKNIGYISLCGYEGLSRDVFPSLFRSWISPTMNPLSRIPLFAGMSLPLVSMDIQNYSSGNLSSWLGSLSKLRSVWIQCHSEIQLTQESRRILDDQYDVNSMDLEASSSSSSYASQISDFSLKSLLIRLGSCHTVLDTLANNISQGLTTNDSSNFFLPGGNYPSWLAYKGEGPSVHFQVPEDCDCCLKGIVLCVVYSSTPENIATECLTSVMINNRTKFTIQIYKQDTVMSFNDEDWESVKSNLDPGDNMEIVVSFGRGLTVKETAVYLINAQSITMEIEPSPEVNMQPSPSMKMEPSPKPTKHIFTRLAKRIRKCSCLNQN